ncbi:hypothetical protein BH11BAC4_BH11BAC4_16790 [soil metagenome]
MAKVIQFDAIEFDNLINKFVPADLVSAAKSWVTEISSQYEANNHSILKLNEDISVSDGKFVMITKDADDVHTIFIDTDSIGYDKIAAKVPPRQGGGNIT